MLLVLHLSCPLCTDNGHWFSHMSMRSELVNCQGSHLREPIPSNSLSVNVNLSRKMRQLHLVDLQGQKKGKCVFLTKDICTLIFLIFLDHCSTLNCDSLWYTFTVSTWAETECWNKLWLWPHHSPLCVVLIRCSDVNYTANWNEDLSQ